MRRSLTDEQVKEARHLYHEIGQTQREIAQKFSCSIVTISLWVDPNEDRRVKKFGPQQPKQILIDEAKLNTVRQLKEQGFNSREVHLITQIDLAEVNRYYSMCPVDLSDVFSFD